MWEVSLRGEHVAIEELRPEHAARLRELHATPEVARWWFDPEPDWPLEEHDDLVQLVVTVDGEVAGFLQFAEETDPNMRSADVDVFLGPAHHDRGLGTDTMRAIVRHLVEDRGHHRITLSTSPENHRAIRVYEKVGFRAVGITRKSQRNQTTGEWEDELLMELVV